MMKIISKIAVTALALSLAGCGNNFLDTSLDLNHTPETAETNRNTIWQFANSMYAPMDYGFYTLDDNLFAPATDEAVETKSWGNVYTFTQGILTPTNNPLWWKYRACYEGIRAANFFLDYVADGKGEALLALNFDTIRNNSDYRRDLRYLDYSRAEAHVLKAYYYGELIKMYGGVPIVETDFEQSPDLKYPQKDYSEVVTYIVKLIDDNKDKLVVDWSDENDTGRNGRYTLGVALAIKARILLYAASPLHNPSGDTEKWLAAAEAAHDIIVHPALNYGLDGDYATYFHGSNPLTSGETIYAMRYAESNDPERRNYPIATAGGQSGVTPTHSLVKAYEKLSNVSADPANYAFDKDPRLDATVVVPGTRWNGRVIDPSAGGTDDQSQTNASKTGYYLKKFLTDNLNLTQGQEAQHNWVVYRYAEVLLNYAEAMNEVYGPDNAGAFTLTAREALQMVRDRASPYLPDVTTTDKGVFRDAVKHERRIELAFEDHRYWDLLRWKDAETVLNQPVTGVEVSKSGNGYVLAEKVVATRTFHASRNYLLPFLRSEVVNSGGNIKQNPGYE